MPRTPRFRLALPVCLCAALLALPGCGRASLSNLFTPTNTLSPTPTATFTPSPTGTITGTPPPTDIPTPTPSETPTPTPSDTPSQTPTETSTITPGPSPTPTNLPTITLSPSITPTPTITRTPTRTLIPTRTRIPSRTPTITNTPTITLTPTPPEPPVYIVRPGLLSRLVSPIQAEIYARPGEDGLVRVELIGEDGRLIARQVLDFSSYIGRAIAFYPKIPFEIQSAAETARLQVLTSDRFGRAVSIMSVDLVLLKVGRNEIYTPLVTQEPFIIRFPKDGMTIAGGSLPIEGLIRPVNQSPVIIEAAAENGAVLFTKQITVPEPTGQLSHTPFQVEIPYRVDTATPVRLIFRQDGSRIPGTVILSSLTLTLAP